jgi:acyl-CoA reductase-like NAD-dependent aldehyde dehydrogenase
MQMQRWLLEFPATVRKAALSRDIHQGINAMGALQQHYQKRTPDERQAIYLSLARTILEDLDHDRFQRVEDLLLEIGLLHTQRA